MWASSCGHHHAGIAMRESPRRHRHVGIAMRASPCGNRHAGIAMWESPCGHHHAGIAMRESPCRRRQQGMREAGYRGALSRVVAGCLFQAILPAFASGWDPRSELSDVKEQIMFMTSGTSCQNGFICPERGITLPSAKHDSLYVRTLPGRTKRYTLASARVGMGPLSGPGFCLCGPLQRLPRVRKQGRSQMWRWAKPAPSHRDPLELWRHKPGVLAQAMRKRSSVPGAERALTLLAACRTTQARATPGTCSSHGPVWALTCQALASGAGVCVEAGIRPQADTQTASGQAVLSSARGPGRVCDWLRLFCPPTAGVLVEPGWFSARTADGLVPTALADIRAWAPGSLEAKGVETG